MKLKTVSQRVRIDSTDPHGAIQEALSFAMSRTPIHYRWTAYSIDRLRAGGSSIELTYEEEPGFAYVSPTISPRRRFWEGLFIGAMIGILLVSAAVIIIGASERWP